MDIKACRWFNHATQKVDLPQGVQMCILCRKRLKNTKNLRAHLRGVHCANLSKGTPGPKADPAYRSRRRSYFTSYNTSPQGKMRTQCRSIKRRRESIRKYSLKGVTEDTLEHKWQLVSRAYSGKKRQAPAV